MSCDPLRHFLVHTEKKSTGESVKPLFEQEISRKELRRILRLRIEQLRSEGKKLPSKLSQNKGVIHTAFKQVKGRILELERFERHLLYEDFPEGFVHGKD